ncbi:MAG: hypothetical protein KatS3mg011_1055 [Acidimicrobiia bacterium]|nr:MAG: hypothetical protein KatS3mg011_1055 [Acidimicrobiia bacterium]
MPKPHRIAGLLCSVLLLWACGGGDTAPTTTVAVETPSPTGTSDGTATTSQPPSAGGFGAVAPSEAGFSDYRARFDMSGSAGEETFQMSWIMEQVLDPPAFRIVFEGTSGQVPATEVVGIGDEVWVKVGDQWMYSAQAGFTPPDPESFFDLFTVEPEGWEEVGTEEVAGRPTRHLRVTWNVTDPGVVAPTLLSGGRFQLTGPAEVQADVWVDDQDVVWRWTYQTEASAQVDGEQTDLVYQVSFEIEGVDLGLVIEPPAAAPEGAPGGVPVPEGAVMVMSSESQAIFQVSDMPIDEVVAFYDQALPQAGFEVSNRIEQPGAGAVYTVEKEGTTFTVAVAPSGTGTVTISIAGS